MIWFVVLALCIVGTCAAMAQGEPGGLFGNTAKYLGILVMIGMLLAVVSWMANYK